MKPLAIDLMCGLGGWTEGLLAEGWRVIGFDIEAHAYGDARYPAQLVIQDVLTLHGSMFRKADLIVASPPCQFFSYTAMPWSRAKALAAKVRANPYLLEKELALFKACFRIQREASEAAGRHIPLIVENVRGAEPWVDKAKFAYGSYLLWGDIPAVMPKPDRARKLPGFRFDGSGRSFQTASVKAAGGSNVRDGARHTARLTNPAEGRKGAGAGAEWFDGNLCAMSSGSIGRKAASAMIAKIPFELSRHIARVYRPSRAVG